jgi:hypothetical protein
MHRRLLLALVWLYFFVLTRGTLTANFTPDDMMNLYRSWSFPLKLLVRANLLFWETSEFYRPMGSVWYRSIYWFAGFHPMPFHVVLLVILTANILLTYAVARRLSGSAEVGLITALLGCYHTSFANLYFDTGFIYDVLCYFFYFAAFLLYCRIRQDGGIPRGWRLAVLLGLYICALNSKEMAVTFPLFLLIYEWLYHRPDVRSAKSVGRWLGGEGRAVWITGIMTAVFAVGRMTGEYSLAKNPTYAMHFTWQQLMETSRLFLGSMAFRPQPVETITVLLVWAAMIAVAWAVKSRVLRFAVLFGILGTAPIAFSVPRGAPQYYVPWFGWALLAAAVLWQLWSRLPVRASLRQPVVLVGALLLILFPFYLAMGWQNVASVWYEGPVQGEVARQLLELYPSLPRGSRLLFLDDPIKPDREDLIFIVRLRYGNDSITVRRMKQMGHRPADEEIAQYDHVFDYKAGHFVELSRPWTSTVTPMLFRTPEGAGVYHRDWEPVSARKPARRGEFVISKAVDLGETTPAVPAGQPFPGHPFAQLSAKVEVRVNGIPADVDTRLGWPAEVNVYRVDFKVPEAVRPGMAKVEVTASGVTGPPSYIPVK